MRYSSIIMTICVLEVIFWVSTASAGSAGNDIAVGAIPDTLSERWASNLHTTTDNAKLESIDAIKSTHDAEEDSKCLSSVEGRDNDCPPITTEPAVGKPIQTNTNQHRTDSSHKRHESPPQRPKKPRNRYENEENSKRLPFFVHLGALLLILLVLHAFATRLEENAKGGFVATIVVLVRPVLNLQSQLFSIAVDVALLALFASALQHLGECSHHSSCNIVSLDGMAALSGLVAILSLLQLHGGLWVQQALGTPPTVTPAAALNSAKKKEATGVGIVAIDVYFPHLYVGLKDLGEKEMHCAPILFSLCMS